MPTVRHMRVAQGYRPWTNPRRAMLGAIGAVDPNCANGMPFDTSGAPCIDECAAGMPYDSNGNPCPAPSQPAQAAGVPSGGYVAYTGQWITTTTRNANDIIQAVIAALPAQGLRVTNFSSSAGMLANTKIIGIAESGQTFAVSLQLQVSGSGFGQASDVASIVDHFVYAASGKMPLSSSAGYQGTGSSTSGGAPPPPGSATDLTTWLENNALVIGLGVLAAFVLPKVL